MSKPGRVAIVGGTGALGYGLALRCASGGIRVGIGSRDRRRADAALKAAREALRGGPFFAGQNPEVTSKAEVVVLCVPFANQVPALHSLKDSWRPGQVLLETTVPLASRSAQGPLACLACGKARPRSKPRVLSRGQWMS